jgi:oligopeptide/dipeptide ABC transporter ATP-binding protein
VTEPLLRCEDVVKHFPIRGSRDQVHAVNGVSVEVAPGETLAVVGESGSGKTTLGRIILGLLRPTAGRVVFRGEDLAGLEPRRWRPYRAKIQGVFQDPYDALDPRMKVGRSISEPLERLELDSLEVSRRRGLHQLAEIVGLEERALDRYPHELSAGQQQKVGIARALASSPDLIVLDEPTSVLPPAGRAEIVALLERLQEELRITYVFISHDLTVVETVATVVAVMYLGKIVELGFVDDIFERPLHPYTRALLSTALLADPRQRGTIQLLKGEIPSPINLPTGCAFASRCPIGDSACTVTPPPLEIRADEVRVDARGQERRVACFKADESARTRWDRRVFAARPTAASVPDGS